MLLKIQWHEPNRLLHTLGASWKFQIGPETLSQVKTTLPSHFGNWMEKTDKQLHPIYLILSGPGTGKSRLLQEFPDLCRRVTSELLEETAPDQRELVESLDRRLKNALVFHVYFFSC